ncbi:hypothetical protein HON22_05150, partial [Candidatus Peregrinibacteria bacterium]|nr:hypothetical protein [Candidatus Peregrinibacteria bacterium]
MKNSLQKFFATCLSLALFFSQTFVHAALVADSSQFPMTLWGTLKSNGSSISTGATVEFYNDDSQVGDTLTTIFDGQYGNHGAQGGDVAIGEFTNSLSMKVTVSGTTYDETESMLDDSEKDSGCPSASSITYVAGALCKYNIDLGVDLSSSSSSSSSDTSTDTTTTTSSSGGGGSAGTTVKAPFQITSDVSNRQVTLADQKLDLSGSNGSVNQPIKMSTSNKYFVNIPQATTITYKDGSTFSGILNYPKKVAKENRPSAPTSYQTATVVEVGAADGKSLQFSKPFTLTIPIEFSETVEVDKVQVQYYDEESGSYKIAGDGGLLASDQKSITVEVDHMTLFAVFFADEFA